MSVPAKVEGTTLPVPSSPLPSIAPGDTGRPALHRRAVVTLAMAGHTELQIADKVGLSRRQVRRLLSQARAQGSLRYVQPSAEQVVAHEMLVADMLLHGLMRRYAAAEERGDDKVLCALAREIRATEAARVAMLGATGWFKANPLQEPAPIGPTADEDGALFRTLFRSMARAKGHAVDDTDPLPLDD